MGEVSAAWFHHLQVHSPPTLAMKMLFLLHYHPLVVEVLPVPQLDRIWQTQQYLQLCLLEPQVLAILYHIKHPHMAAAVWIYDLYVGVTVLCLVHLVQEAE